MTVMEKIAECALPRAAGLRLEELAVGVGYTAVRLSDGSGGVAYTFRNELGETCGVLRGAGTLAGTPAETALGWALSRNRAEAALGVATVNALLNRDYERGGNIADAVECSPADTVGMVGWFCPLVWKYSGAGTLHIFERNLRSAGLPGSARAHGEDEEEALLPRCNRIVLTGTCFINGTADRLLELCRGAEELILVGASTPMCPAVLREYGVTVLAGTRILDAAGALRVAAQGGGGMDFGPYAAKLLERI